MSLLSRISGIQGQQRQRLISHRQRQEKAKAEAERGPEEVVEEQLAEQLAPIVDLSAGPDTPIPARALFKALLEPLTKSMGCDAAEISWIEENWGKEPDLIPTLVDWSRKVILEGLDVPEDALACCDQVYRRGPSSLSLAEEPQHQLGDEQPGEDSRPAAADDAPEPPRRKMRP